MPLHLAARIHALWHGLFRPRDEVETRDLYARVAGLFERQGLLSPTASMDLVTRLIDDLLAAFDCTPDHPQRVHIGYLVLQLFEYEKLFTLPEIDWSETRSVSAYWEIRNELNRQKRLVEDFRATYDLLRGALKAILDPIYEAAPYLLDLPEEEAQITVPSALIHSLGNIGEVTEWVWRSALSEKLEAAGLLTRQRELLIGNLIEASGGNRRDQKHFNKPLKLPGKSDIKDPGELLYTYLGGTPIFDFFTQSINFSVPTTSRFEHHHIVAGSGHGKTQTLQYLIAEDLKAVSVGKRSLIVLDSQGDLIRNISNLAEFAPGGELHDRIVIIDPTDVEYPVSLNLFDVGMDRLSGYAPLERERLQNSILELYDFVLGTLLSAEMTQKQSVIFRYVTRLMLHIPDATIHTLRDLMEPGSHVRFAAHIESLTGTAKHFFETEFPSKEFEQTKKQVLRRLWGILENQTFERMFSHPRSKLNLYAEMNAGKVILINTAKDLLKEQGTEIFGRFFIAMIAQAAQERATLPEHKRMPTMVYIDEAQDYFDRNISIILAQARKYGVGMVLAHQYLGQLEPRLQEAFAANTSIKFAGGVSAKDVRTLAPMLYTDPKMIEAQPKGSFAAYIRGVTPRAVPLQFPFGHMEGMEKMSQDERGALQASMRERYAVHYSTLHGSNEASENTHQPPKSDQSPKKKTHLPQNPDATDTTAGDSW